MTELDDALREAPPARLDIPVIRDYLAAHPEFRADGENDAESNNDSPGTMFGHFATFNQFYRIQSFWEGDFVERIAPKSFNRTIKNRSGETPVRALFDHGFDMQMGDKPMGIPEILEERDKGPYQETPLFRGVPDLIVEGLRAGAYSQSFRFRVLADSWVEEAGAKGWDNSVDSEWAGLPQRTITEVKLIEFGPTPFPANPNADAGLRSATDQFYETLKRRDPDAVAAALARTAELRKAGVGGTIIDLGNKSKDKAEDKAPARTEDPVPSGTDETKDSSATHPKDPPKPGTPPARVPARHSAAHTSNTERDSAMAYEDTEPLTAEERVARQSEIQTRLQEIDSEYNGAPLPPEVQTEWDTISEETDYHERAIQADQKRKARLEQLAGRNGSGETAGSIQRPTDSSTRRPDNIFDLAAIRQQARSIDEMPRLYRDNAMRAIEQAHFNIPKNRKMSQEDAQENLRHILETVDSPDGKIARRILETGSKTYARAFGKWALAQGTGPLTSEEQRALAVGAVATGGYAVPFQLDPTLILTNSGVINPLRDIARVEQIVGKEWDGLTTAGITVSRAAEAAQSADNAPTLGQPTVKAERVQGFVPFSIEADQDWQNLQSEMTRLLADAKDVEEATAFTLGTGVSPDANGFLNETAGITVAQNVVANTVTLASLYALEAALPVRFRANARFIASKSIYSAIRQLDTTGGSGLWARLGEGQPPRLLDYPAHELSTMPSSGVPALNDRWLVFGDWSNFLIVDRVGMNVDLIPHLFGANQRPTGQRGLYAMWRNNAKVLVDGAFKVNKRTT
jgi:HK97 family phage major capsid protein